MAAGSNDSRQGRVDCRRDARWSVVAERWRRLHLSLVDQVAMSLRDEILRGLNKNSVRDIISIPFASAPDAERWLPIIARHVAGWAEASIKEMPSGDGPPWHEIIVRRR